MFACVPDPSFMPIANASANNVGLWVMKYFPLPVNI